MRTVVLTEPFKLELKEAQRPMPQPGEALLRVRHIGICGTDLHAFQGQQPFFTYPRILGHELAVEIVAFGGESGEWKVSETAVVLPYLSCGKCLACRQGKTNCCTTLKVLGVHIDGGMQEYFCAPVANLVKAEGLTLEQMALVENQCIGAHAVRRAQLMTGEWALVIGAGPIGIGVVQFAKAAGAKVIVLDMDQPRLDFCRKHLGVTCVVNARTDPAAQLESLTDGEYPTAVFDATGNARSMMSAFNYVAHGGRLIFVGLVQADISFNDPNFHKHELTVLSSRNATRADFDHVIHAMRTGQIVTAPLMTHRASLEQMVIDFPAWLKPETGVIKAIVKM